MTNDEILEEIADLKARIMSIECNDSLGGHRDFCLVPIIRAEIENLKKGLK